MPIVEWDVAATEAHKKLWITDRTPRSSPPETLSDALTRYASEISPTKRGASQECYKLRKLARASIAGRLLDELTTMDFERYRDERINDAATSTVRQELCLMRRAIDAARLTWGHQLPGNPTDGLSIARQEALRDRRATREEIDRVLDHLEGGPMAGTAIRLSAELKIGLGRLLALRWADVAAMPAPARQIAKQLITSDGSRLLLPVKAHTLRRSWQRACEKAGVANLLLRDLAKGYARDS